MRNLPFLSVVALAGASRAHALGGNLPPSVPVPNNPSEFQGATTQTPVFSWQASIDPEGGHILYEVEVYDDLGHLFGAVGVRDGTVTSLASVLTNGASYTWRLRAVDDLGLASEYSPTITFSVNAPVDDPEVTVNGAGCSAGRAPDAGTLLVAAAALLSRARRRRRVSGRAK